MYQSIHKGTDIDASVLFKRVTEQDNTGIRLINAPENKHGDIGQDAIDISYQNDLSFITGALGDYSLAAGYCTTAKSINSFACGAYNIGLTDSIFEVGVGSLGDLKNALEIYTDGTLTAPEASPAGLEARGNKSLVTIEYLLSPEFGNSLDEVDPFIIGAIWNNNGVLTISAG